MGSISELVADRRVRMVGGLLALVVAGILPALSGSIAIRADASFAVIFALGILSVVVLTGYVGQVSLCQATFMGISAYGTAWLVNSGVNYWVAAVVGVILAFGLGVLVGIPALRLRGILLAIVTVGVALSFDVYFFQDDAFAWFNGGGGGWGVDGATLFGLQLDAINPENVLHTYWLLLAVFAVVAILLVNLHDSGSGRRFRAIRDSELAAATMGVNLTKYKLLGFGISAAVAGIGGAFFPVVLGRVSSQPFSFFYSLQFAAFAVLMGVRFVPAAAMAGVFMAFVPELLIRLSGAMHVEISYDYFSIVLGALLVLQLITAPEGVWGDSAARIHHLLHRNKRVVAEPTKVITT
ncbi:MAG: branched-chain amino acid transport system permease protein [Chloroflexota bacterium]|jgi:ABC-type branched-subunit amino acid transport system permease subunit|nr:branched-chain amino acid transport system permease protein [Chloroflexota bacterium]